ncbi:MAG: Glucosaminyl phosphatidylinositol (GlcN-PI) nositol acylation protein [Thelocarpon superellum]|nr:MAG: Glucosaminyl phosphatidylinositol (GlcN-PI) nositol acylation protein [Thelocarpon superellum]
MANSYKSLKEDFVSNLSGGDIAEINYVTAIAPSAIVLWSALQSRLCFYTPYTPAAFLADFLLNCGGILLATTLYSSTPLLLNVLLLSPALILYWIPPARPSRMKAKPPQARPSDDAEDSSKQPSKATSSAPFPQKAFLTTYRGCMMVVTCVAILAVDFRIFPRRFAKVENWGTSLMDLGVGSFVFSAGLVAARPVLKERFSGQAVGLGRRLYRSVKHSIPLLVLGLVRLYSVKGLDYAEHVTEYGVHWNFFFTLAFLPPFVALFQSLFALIPSYALLSVLLGGGYQFVLETTRLKAFILVGPRTNLFSQNREGVFSFLGYLAIFLAGQATGMYVLPAPPTLKHASSQSTTITSGIRQRFLTTYRRNPLAFKLAAWSIVWTVLFELTNTPVYGLSLTVSRRLANLPYVLWVTAFNVTQILAFYAVEMIFFPMTTTPTAAAAASDTTPTQARTSQILRAYNRNGLFIFLVANLLTGAVNLSVDTLHRSVLESMSILVAYLLVLTGLAVGLDLWRVDLKI